jgi:hypothetical protein
MRHDCAWCNGDSNDVQHILSSLPLCVGASKVARPPALHVLLVYCILLQHFQLSIQSQLKKRQRLPMRSIAKPPVLHELPYTSSLLSTRKPFRSQNFLATQSARTLGSSRSGEWI